MLEPAGATPVPFFAHNCPAHTAFRRRHFSLPRVMACRLACAHMCDCDAPTNEPSQRVRPRRPSMRASRAESFATTCVTALKWHYTNARVCCCPIMREHTTCSGSSSERMSMSRQPCSSVRRQLTKPRTRCKPGPCQEWCSTAALQLNRNRSRTTLLSHCQLADCSTSTHPRDHGARNTPAVAASSSTPGKAALLGVDKTKAHQGMRATRHGCVDVVQSMQARTACSPRSGGCNGSSSSGCCQRVGALPHDAPHGQAVWVPTASKHSVMKQC